MFFGGGAGLTYENYYAMTFAFEGDYGYKEGYNYYGKSVR